MPGKIVHFELPAADADRASGFWNGLFGWGLGASAMPDFDYRMAQVSDDQAVAVFPSEDKAGTGPIVYFETPDIEASIAKARSLGGRPTTSRRSPVTAGSPRARTPRATPSASGSRRDGRAARVTSVAVGLAVLAGLSGSVQVAVMGRFGAASA